MTRATDLTDLIHKLRDIDVSLSEESAERTLKALSKHWGGLNNMDLMIEIHMIQGQTNEKG